ncbi:hypothetical protein KCU87_g397, partial [Aureobasidium melanogenum]
MKMIELLAISITNVGINVVVVQDPAHHRIIVNTLTTRSVNVSMRRQHKGTATVGTALAGLIHETASSRVGSADLNLVLLASGRAVLVQVAADAFAEEHVVATVVVDHAPPAFELTKEPKFIRFAAVGRDASRALVGPGADIHRRRSCETNDRVLGAEGACGVIEVVGIANQRNIRCPQIGLSRVGYDLERWKQCERQCHLQLRSGSTTARKRIRNKYRTRTRAGEMGPDPSHVDMGSSPLCSEEASRTVSARQPVRV